MRRKQSDPIGAALGMFFFAIALWFLVVGVVAVLEGATIVAPVFFFFVASCVYVAVSESSMST